MRSLVTRALLLSLLLAVCAPAVSRGQVGKDTTLWNWTVPAPHHKPIVKVALDGAEGTGTIIHVDRSQVKDGWFGGYCLTAHHVVAGDKGRRAITVTYRDGIVSRKCWVLEFDERLDVAIVQVRVPDGIIPAKLAGVPVRRGARLELAGLGGSSQLSSHLRHFSARASQPTNNNQIFCDVPLLPGDSGGPVFNEDHEVVGVISGGWFWWDGGITTDRGLPINATWPARACNAAVIQQLLGRAKEINIARR